MKGRLDLTQVEGIKDLIDAETEEQRKVAVRAVGVGEKCLNFSSIFAWHYCLKGKVKDEMDHIRQEVIKCLALVEALIDFGEGEDIEEGVYDQGS
jgi:tRNA modification GTPase